MLLALGGIYTFAGVSGFLEEKRSGALELLLVTPLSVNRLIFGRVWGLWKQFLPAALVLASFYTDRQWQMYLSHGDWFGEVQTELILVCGFLTLPIVATYFALRVKNLIVAAVLTWVSLCLPAISGGSTGLIAGYVDMGFTALVVFFSYAAFAGLACFLLRHSLSRRIYSF